MSSNNALKEALWSRFTESLQGVQVLQTKLAGLKAQQQRLEAEITKRKAAVEASASMPWAEIEKMLGVADQSQNGQVELPMMGRKYKLGGVSHWILKALAYFEDENATSKTTPGAIRTFLDSENAQLLKTHHPKQVGKELSRLKKRKVVAKKRGTKSEYVTTSLGRTVLTQLNQQEAGIIAASEEKGN